MRLYGEPIPKHKEKAEMRETIEHAYKTALKAGDKRRTATLRAMIAAISPAGCSRNMSKGPLLMSTYFRLPDTTGPQPIRSSNNRPRNGSLLRNRVTSPS